jgi:hypothetical protein
MCFADRQDRPLRATLELRTTAAEAALCACWSAGEEAPCARAGNRCVSAAAGATASLELPMAMICGERDAGQLEVELRAAPGAECAEWALSWQIVE